MVSTERDKQTLCTPNERQIPLSRKPLPKNQTCIRLSLFATMKETQENILSKSTGMQSAYFILSKILQDQKKNYSNK